MGLKKLTAIFCLLLLFVATACEQQSAGVATDEQTVDINLNIFLGLKAVPDNGTEQERKVTSLRVYAFHPNGYLDKMEYVENATGLTGNPYVMDMTVFSGQKIFCLIANEPSRLTSVLSSIKNRWDLQALTMQTSDFTFNDPVQGLLPMTSTTSATITSNHTTPVNLSLERAVAKTEIKIIKDKDNPDVVKLKSIQVKNTPGKSRLMENNLLDVSSSLINFAAQDHANVIIGSTSADTLTLHSGYLFEHHTGVGDPAALNSTVLYTVLNIKGTDTEYAIPLHTIAPDAQKHNNVLRNHYYRLIVTVGDGALEVDYTIRDWDDETPWDKELGKKTKKQLRINK